MTCAPRTWLSRARAVASPVRAFKLEERMQTGRRALRAACSEERVSASTADPERRDSDRERERVRERERG